MKQCFCLFLFVFAALLTDLVIADVDISLQPTPVIVGEPATLTIRSTEGLPEIETLPEIKNMKWGPSNIRDNSVMIINGTRFEIANYQIIPEKVGTIVLPPLKIKVGNKSFETQSREVAVASGPLADLEKHIFLQPMYGIKSDTIYVGQEVPLEIYLYKASHLSANPIEYPQVKLDNVMFGNFRDINKENDRFAQYPYYQPSTEVKNGANYLKTCFYTTLLPIAAGKLDGSVSLMIDVAAPKQRGRGTGIDNGFFNMSFPFGDDPFFGGNKRFTKLITAKLPELNVLLLPPVPEKANFIGLFGKWNIKFDISQTDNLREGDSLTITINIEGHGSLESLKAPSLSMPSFTVYPPEIKKYDMDKIWDQQVSKAVITYVLVPTQAGRNNISILLATFDHSSKKYTMSDFKTTVNVMKNNLNSNNSYFTEKTPEKTKDNIVDNKSKRHPNDMILYIKKYVSSEVSIPLWKNHLMLTVIFILAGPLLLLCFELGRFRHAKINTNDYSRRRYKAEKAKKNILRTLKSKNPEQLPSFVNSDVVKLINDLSGYPPGTTVHELEKLLNDKDLLECLTMANSMSYIPGSINAGSDLKKRLYKALKRFSMFTIVFLSICVGSGMLGESKIPDVDSFVIRYNKGEFKEAEQICLNNIEKTSPNPTWLYNLGECYYNEGNMAKAMICFQRALLLAPRDSDILQNLNHVREKLFLPPLYTSRTPIELVVYLRDIFRPDEWFLLCAIAVFFIFIALILRRFIHGIVWSSILATAAVITIISLSASIYQSNTMYSGSDAVIIERNSDIYSLPSIDSQKSKVILTSGESVKIEDTIGDWVLIRDAKTSGWIKRSAVEMIWPY